MIWLKILFLLICIASISSSEEASSSSSSSAETNEIDPTEAVRKIDPTLREALLRAIDKLEKQAAAEAEDEEDEDEDAVDESEEETSTRKEELLEESTLSDDIIPTVQFFTASIDKTERKPDDNLIKSILDNAAIPKDNSDGDDVKINFGIPAVVAQNVLPLDTNQQTRSISSDNSNEIGNEISEPKKITLISTTRPPRRRTTTTEGTTTTRKPAPTHNEDGENIEVVEKEDIKILQAPLVTAFTVHQDEQGAAKKVIPLFQPPVPPPLPASPVRSPVIINPVPQPLIQQNSDTEIIKSTTTILLPTPVPAADHSSANFVQSPSAIQNLQAQLPVPSFLQGIIPQNQSLPIVQSNQIPFSSSPSLQQQSVFSVQQTPQPLTPTFTPQTPSINDYLFERQRLLEQQIYQLQLQARQQQEQILHQQRLLFEQQSKKFEQQNNQVKSTNSFNDITIRPSLEVLPSIAHAPRFEFNTELQLPVKEAVNFRPTFNPPVPHHRTSIQVQPSNQINFPPQQHINPQPQQQPLELSTFQQLPQKTFQSFNPNAQQFLGPVNPSLLKSGTSDQNSIHRTRHFRQESGTGNFGFNNFFSPNQNFQRSGSGHSSDSQRQNNLFQPALNHGISPHAQQNLHFNGQFRDSF